MVLTFGILYGIGWLLVVSQSIITFLFFLLFYLRKHVIYTNILYKCISTGICVLAIRLLSARTSVNEILDYLLLRCLVRLESLLNFLHFIRDSLQVVLNLFSDINDHSVYLNDLIVDERGNIEKINLCDSNWFCDFLELFQHPAQDQKGNSEVLLFFLLEFPIGLSEHNQALLMCMEELLPLMPLILRSALLSIFGSEVIAGDRAADPRVDQWVLGQWHPFINTVFICYFIGY